MSLFDSLKEEARKRNQEKQDSNDFIERERERIQQRRQEARENRNIIRKKIKFVDDIASKKEQEQDAEELARVEEEQSEKIKRARVKRRNRAVILPVSLIIRNRKNCGKQKSKFRSQIRAWWQNTLQLLNLV